MASLPYPRSYQTIFPQNPQNPQKPLAEISSHRCHRCSQIFLAEIFSHGLHRTRRILAPSLCNYRRVWHPAIPTHPPRGCSGLHCTNQAATASSHRIHRTHRHLLLRYPPPETSVNSVNSVGEPYASKPSVCICAICGRIIKWVAWVWQGCHTLLSVFCGRTRTLNFCGFRAFRGRTRIPWGENTKRAWQNAMPSYVSYVDAWVWQGCHTLL